MVVRLNKYIQTIDIAINEKLEPCYNSSDEDEKLQYFYHPDHLGSSSFITDATGYAVQHLQYLPFGETFVDQQNGYDSRYTFSAKEKDDETQYSYFGARYYDSDLSVWLTVDPMARKYAGVSPYAYSLNNPIVFKDPDGRDVVVAVQDAGTSSTSGHMRMFVSTYEEVNVLIDGEERTMYKSTGVAMIQNWPHGTNTATEVEDNYQADVREGNVQIFVLDKDNRAVMGDDGQMYYTAETTQLERDIYADASSRNEPYRDGTSYLDQNDCSSIIISLLYRNGYKKLKYGEKTGTTTVDVQGQDYTFYTPNSIALDLGENHKAITIKPQNARDITFKNAMEFLKGVIESNL